MAPDRVSPPIRPATLHDVQALARIGARCYLETYEAFVPSEQLNAYVAEAFSPERTAEVLADPKNCFLVAEVDGVLCGAAHLRTGAAPPAVGSVQPVELVSMGTAPGRRGQGVGAALMRSVLRTAAEAEHATLWLRVWEGNARAVAFYRRWGFAPIITEPDLRFPLLATALVMARPLSTYRPDRYRSWTPLWLEFSHFAPG